MKCRAKGRLTIQDAVTIGEQMGIFEEEDFQIVTKRDRKQQVRLLLGSAKYGGERVLRSLRIDNEIFYVDITDPKNKHELDLIIQAQEAKLRKCQNIVRSLKAIKGEIEGQIRLDEYYPDDQPSVTLKDRGLKKPG
jgi:hypothetical protein